jgi:hypothetical protein
MAINPTRRGLLGMLGAVALAPLAKLLPKSKPVEVYPLEAESPYRCVAQWVAATSNGETYTWSDAVHIECNVSGVAPT